MTPSDVKATLSFSDGSPSMELPIYKGTHRPRRRSTSASSTPRPACSPTTPASPRPRSCESDDHLHRRRRGRAAVPRLPDRAAGRALRLPRDLLPAAVRRAADRGAEATTSSYTRHPPHDGARADDRFFHGLPPRRAPDGDHGRRWSARCRPSITTRTDINDPQQRDDRRPSA